jgi:phosphonate transport system ATP-binding protein
MIRVENLSLNFPGGITALHPLSLEFRAGQFTVLLGASGAGKYSLIRCLNFLQQPTTGSISTQDLGELDRPRVIRHHRRHTAMIFQQLAPPL